MKTRIALLLIFIIVALVRAEGEPAPKLELAEKDHLFEPCLVGDKVTHVFKVKNAGTADLIIRRVDPTCGCTATKCPKDPIKPGAVAAIELTVDTSEKNGAWQVAATIYSNDMAQALAGGPGTTRIELKGEAQTCFKLMPTGAFFPPMIRGRQPELREIQALGQLDAAKGFEIGEIEVPADWVKVEKSALDGKPGWKLKVSILPHVPEGQFREWETGNFIIVHTNIPRQPLFRIPVVGSATGPVKVGPAETIFFGNVRRGATPDRLVLVERVDHVLGLPILDIDYDKARFTIDQEVIVDDTRTDLRVKIKPDAPIGPFSDIVTIKLDMKEEPFLRFPVYGTILPRVQPDPALVILHADDAKGTLSVRIDKGKLVSAQAEGFSVSLEGDERIRTVTLTPSKPLAKGQKGTVELKTDVAGEETVRVPIEVR
ncbi:MAG TPA: DUF1573 domain-containing protein [Planctomycetota bacterium]|nr:DUF1573 domain-containing protein [Planctomycetota bacterium]